MHESISRLPPSVTHASDDFEADEIIGNGPATSPANIKRLSIIIPAYNLPVSAFVWRLRPLVSGRIGGLLLADVILATIITALTGGRLRWQKLRRTGAVGLPGDPGGSGTATAESQPREGSPVG